jgi:uncharacterized protein YndB with AHSA1/START domain
MNPNRTSLEQTSDREIVLSRRFRAPPPVVFAAWTKPEFVKRWWAPASRGASVLECDADVRPGGEYRYVTAVGPEHRFTFFGKYLEVVPPSRLVYTQIFEPFPDAEVIVTVSFEAREGSTLLVSRELYPSKEALEGAMASGMEDGVRETFEQLDELVASLPG